MKSKAAFKSLLALLVFSVFSSCTDVEEKSSESSTSVESTFTSNQDQTTTTNSTKVETNSENTFAFFSTTEDSNDYLTKQGVNLTLWVSLKKYVNDFTGTQVIKGYPDVVFKIDGMSIDSTRSIPENVQAFATITDSVSNLRPTAAPAQNDIVGIAKGITSTHLLKLALDLRKSIVEAKLKELFGTHEVVGTSSLEIEIPQFDDFQSVSAPKKVAFTEDLINLIANKDTRAEFVLTFKTFIAFLSESRLDQTNSVFTGMPTSVNAFFYDLKAQEKFLKENIFNKLEASEPEIRAILSKQNNS